MPFSPELEAKLKQAKELVEQGQTVVLLFEDMIEVNEHFQAVLEWMRENGLPKERRWGTGCKYPEMGWLYFAGEDTHFQNTRGAALELNLQEHAEELVRQVGMEARLREKGLL